MKKIFIATLFLLLFSNNVLAESAYFFKNCKLSNAVVGSYIINLEKNVIQVELKRQYACQSKKLLIEFIKRQI